MSFTDFFQWSNKPVTDNELPELFPLAMGHGDYMTIDVVTIFSKLLTDTLERTHGMTEDQVSLMWDNCVKSNASDGLITLLAKAMADKADLYVVYDKAVGVVRKADTAEQTKIRDDYEKSATSSTGVFISFKNYRKSDMVRLYSGLSYWTISALNKNLNISAAVQLKVSDLRASVSLTDSAKAEAQGQVITRALLNSRPILIDAKDEVETAKPDLASTEKSIQFIADKLAFYLGMPASYITGEQTGGIGSTGEGDQRAVERGLKGYFESIIKPVMDSVFGIKVSYNSQDFRNLQTGLEALKTMDLISEQFMSAETKLQIINKLFDLPDDTEGGPEPEPVVVTVPPVNGAVPPKAKAEPEA